MTNTALPAATSPTIPHRKGWPGLGILPNLLKPNPFAFLRDVMLEYGDFVRVDLAVQPIYLLSHPDHVQHVMRDKQANYRKPEDLIRPIREVMGNSLLTSSGEVWLRKRRMIQPHLHRKQLGHLFNEMRTAVTETLKVWAERAATGAQIDLRQEMASMTLSVMTRAIFGTGALSPAEHAALAPRISRLADYLGQGFYTSVLPTWLTPGRRQFEADFQELTRVTQHLITYMRQQPEKAAGLLHMLISAVDEESSLQLSNQELFNEVITLFIAGYETTATALTWLGVVLAEHPEVAAKLQAEVHQVLGQRLPTFEDMLRLTYTRQVFMEILRMYTVAPLIPRALNAADQIGPYTLPANALVFVFLYGLHHNPKIWKDPEVFDPERFAPERQAALHPFAYVPFNAGPRKCAGEEFALLEGPLIMAMVFQQFALNVLPGQNYETRLSGTLHPQHGVKATLKALV